MISIETLQQHWSTYLAAWCAIGALVGCALGWLRNRTIAGLILGVTLGPIGWIATLVLTPHFRECPLCSANIRVQVRICNRCGADLAKVDARSSRSNFKNAMTAKGPW
jgi:predicted nucleic acid-binding Zn ribbon protein